jgi:hypothetical protein
LVRISFVWKTGFGPFLAQTGVKKFCLNICFQNITKNLFFSKSFQKNSQKYYFQKILLQKFPKKDFSQQKVFSKIEILTKIRETFECNKISTAFSKIKFFFTKIWDFLKKYPNNTSSFQKDFDCFCQKSYV